MSTERVFPVDPDLEIKEELISIHAINPLVAHNSSARAYMSSSHISQAITLCHGEERIMQTGMDDQFGDNTFSKKIEQDSRVLKIINRYDGVDINSVGIVTSMLIMVEVIETGELDVIELPYYFSLHQYFGFKYVWNKELINSLSFGDVLLKGTVLANSPAVAENNGYKFGVNANIALMTIPEVSEDGVVVSKSLSERMSYDIFETRTVEFGENSFPLNIYGTEGNYKPFPELGEIINTSSVFMALREYRPELAPALMSRKDVCDFNPIFDKAIYVKGPGKEYLDSKGNTIKSGEVVDIKAYHSPRFKKEVYTGTADNVMKYAKGLKRFYQQTIDTYEEFQHEHFKRYKNNDLRVTERFHRLLIDAYAVTNPDEGKIKYSFRNEPMDIYKIDVVLRFRVNIGIGSKITDLSGSKGVVVEVRDDDKMPYNEWGERADIIMDPSSIPSRMNVARLYEQYFNAMSRHTKSLVINNLKAKTNNHVLSINNYSDTDVFEAMNIVCGFLDILGTEQAELYRNINNSNPAEARLLLEDIVKNELYYYYKVSSKKKPYQIVLDSYETIYKPRIGKIFYIEDGEVKISKDDIYIAPMYFILLAKTADNFLASASSKTNHYGLPIGVGNKQRVQMPYRNSPVKILSETESRLYVSYVSRLALAELKDRGNSITTHAHVYNNILNASKPTNIERLVDRNLVPYGNDSALEVVNNIFNAAGIDITYEHDATVIHPEHKG